MLTLFNCQGIDSNKDHCFSTKLTYSTDTFGFRNNSVNQYTIW